MFYYHLSEYWSATKVLYQLEIITSVKSVQDNRASVESYAELSLNEEKLEHNKNVSDMMQKQKQINIPSLTIIKIAA